MADKLKLKSEKVGRWDAVIAMEDDMYSIVSLHNGGVIVSDTNLQKAKNEFINGMMLAEFVYKLYRY